MLLLLTALAAETTRRPEPVVVEFSYRTPPEVFVDAVNEALAQSEEMASVGELLDVVAPLPKKKRVRKPAAKRSR